MSGTPGGGVHRRSPAESGSQQEPEPVDAEFGPPGLVRDHLVALILAGTKTATTSLLADYEREGHPVPVAGMVERVLDSRGHPVAVVRTTSVAVAPLGSVGWEHVVAEGEGHSSVQQWRREHESFWWPHSEQGAGSSAASWDDELVVLQTFEQVRAL